MENINNIFKFEPYKANEILENFYYILPMEIIHSKLYKDKLSSDAKLLYAILLNRFKASAKNNWIDDEGYIYIICTRKSIEELLNISNKTVIKIFKELTELKLILEKSIGRNKPKRIYVGKIHHLDNEDILKCKNYTSGDVKSTPQDVKNLHPKYNNINIKRKCTPNFTQREYKDGELDFLYENLNF